MFLKSRVTNHHFKLNIASQTYVTSKLDLVCEYSTCMIHDTPLSKSWRPGNGSQDWPELSIMSFNHIPSYLLNKHPTTTLLVACCIAPLLGLIYNPLSLHWILKIQVTSKNYFRVIHPKGLKTTFDSLHISEKYSHSLEGRLQAF